MWGQATKIVELFERERIIPTRVGTSCACVIIKVNGGDHPHACGDKHGGGERDWRKTGSSPRVWGQGWKASRSIAQLRIIPTRVGTSRLPLKLCIDTTGSSPRVWGQALKGGDYYDVSRIIPTRVGTSSFHILHYYVVQDHPHACGDKFYRLFALLCALGSSPRVWGQVLAMYGIDTGNGIIPTRVGTRIKRLISQML